MIRIALWLALFAFLVVVGAWPAAAAPVTLAFAGAATLIAAVPGVAWVALGVIAWLKRKPAPAPTKTA